METHMSHMARLLGPFLFLVIKSLQSITDLQLKSIWIIHGFCPQLNGIRSCFQRVFHTTIRIFTRRWQRDGSWSSFGTGTIRLIEPREETAFHFFFFHGRTILIDQCRLTSKTTGTRTRVEDRCLFGRGDGTGRVGQTMIQRRDRIFQITEIPETSLKLFETRIMAELQRTSVTKGRTEASVHAASVNRHLSF